ncbi:hypothetical protein OG453_22845 [Streptomyces sp. NBC_01381]|uniref:hypothetical protein n=1 Tax=Streptomyces sp. NBC_01381 TaxID=2903845 RepID=UPI002250EE45|nr:hypothetical protein [Streptomyces sp. NBC_01381]MCX4669483.1 hypothetical protein [Streptomyces sp. NBC_01381]
MARNSAGPKSFSRALLHAGVTVTLAGAALGVGGAATASAAPAAPEATDDVTAAGAGLHQAVRGGLGPAKNLKLNPLAGTGVDPLDNAVGAGVADFKPITTAAATGPLAGGASLDELPLVGPATGLLPG